LKKVAKNIEVQIWSRRHVSRKQKLGESFRFQKKNTGDHGIKKEINGLGGETSAVGRGLGVPRTKGGKKILGNREAESQNQGT